MEASFKPSYSASDFGLEGGYQMSGYIFMCSTRTKPDCFSYRVFGLPASRVEVVEKIKPNTNLFLFDFDLRLLYGLYVADSSGKLAIEPYAFGGLFPAQVKFSIVRDCLPLPEVAFKDVIKENYYSGSKFKQELSAEQVNKLVALFRPIHIPLPARTTLLHNDWESLHPRHRGSRVQVAKPPYHGQHVAGSGLTNTQLHPSLSHVQEPSLQPLRARNQVVSLRNDKVVPQFDPVLSHQAYHPDDPGLHQHDTHARNAYMHLNSSSTMTPQATSANSYYGTAPMPQSNSFLRQSKAVTPSPPIPSSSMTASQWVAMASEAQTPEAQTPGGQTSTAMIPSSSELNAPYGSNVAVTAHQYPNQGYHSSYQEQSVISDLGHSFQPNSASLNTYYRQSHSDLALVSNSGEVGVDQAYMHNGTNLTALASGYQHQGYPSHYQTPAQTTDHLVNNVPAYVSETYSTYTYWTAAPSGHMNEQYPITQSTAPVASSHPISGYVIVPAYSSGANPTY